MKKDNFYKDTCIELFYFCVGLVVCGVGIPLAYTLSPMIDKKQIRSVLKENNKIEKSYKLYYIVKAINKNNPYIKNIVKKEFPQYNKIIDNPDKYRILL